MATMANIVIKDGSLVDKTFTPVGKPNGVPTWTDLTAGVMVGANRITATIRPATPTAAARVEIRVFTPKLLVPTPPSGIPAVAYQLSSITTFMLSQASTLTERKDVRAFTANLLANAQIIDMIENGATPA